MDRFEWRSRCNVISGMFHSVFFFSNHLYKFCGRSSPPSVLQHIYCESLMASHRRHMEAARGRIGRSRVPESLFVRPMVPFLSFTALFTLSRHLSPQSMKSSRISAHASARRNPISQIRYTAITLPSSGSASRVSSRASSASGGMHGFSGVSGTGRFSRRSGCSATSFSSSARSNIDLTVSKISAM